MTVCPNYCGVTCVNGYCPKANQDEYAERGYDVIRDCQDCIFYKGCEDCCFKDTDICIKKGRLIEMKFEDIASNACIISVSIYCCYVLIKILL